MAVQYVQECSHVSMRLCPHVASLAHYSIVQQYCTACVRGTHVHSSAICSAGVAGNAVYCSGTWAKETGPITDYQVTCSVMNHDHSVISIQARSMQC